MPTLTRSDAAIQQDVLDEFVWDPEVEAPEVGVQVDRGVVVLSGNVDTFATKLAAEEAAHRVEGVRAVANDLSVRTALTRTDADIARDAASALESNLLVPNGKIDITVQNGKVRLEGEVDWAHQRGAAINAVRYLRGVRDVDTHIAIRQPHVAPADVSGGIRRALIRGAVEDADRIRVDTTDGHVHLTGTVRSWPEKREAGLAAWRSPGVTSVTNDLVVGVI
ncbi:MAG: BON domain-containing protein [Chloroflexota bacterium]